MTEWRLAEPGEEMIIPLTNPDGTPRATEEISIDYVIAKWLGH